MAKRQANRVNTVLFDLDDTLLDSFAAKIQALRDTFSQANITGVTPEQFVSGLQGASFKIGFKQLTGSQQVAEDLLVCWRRAYWLKRKGYVNLYPGIREMLGALKSRGVKLGIVSNKRRDFELDGNHVGCVKELKDTGIADMFSAIIGLDDVKEEKPHPAGINLALQQLGSQPHDTLFVGDSAVDIQAAQNAECWSCLATWGITDDTGLPQNIRAHFVVETPRALLSLDCI